MQGGIGISAETAVARAIAAARINRAFFNMGQQSPLFLAVSRVTRSQSKGRESRVEKSRRVFRKAEHLTRRHPQVLIGDSIVTGGRV